MRNDSVSRPITKEYADGYDYIFGKLKKKPGLITVSKWNKAVNEEKIPIKIDPYGFNLLLK